MERILKQINDTRVRLDLSLDETRELQEVLERNRLIHGEPTEDGCRCPLCKQPLLKDRFFCPLCGQRVMYIESDVVAF